MPRPVEGFVSQMAHGKGCYILHAGLRSSLLVVNAHTAHRFV